QFSKTLIDFRRKATPLARAGVQFSKTLIDFINAAGTFIAAGVQFSKTLIDFRATIGRNALCWGSVLKNPDRLLGSTVNDSARLGFSSQKP
ncbi:hypothetical protein ACQX4V_09280, partial [Corynebacterium diphtheriae]